MADLATAVSRLRVLAEAMQGAIGPTTPPNDVRGDRVLAWHLLITSEILPALYAAEPSIAFDTALPAPSTSVLVAENTALRAELDALKAEADSRSMGTWANANPLEPEFVKATPTKRWTPTTPKRTGRTHTQPTPTPEE